MILGLEELKFIFNPVTRLCYSEFEARLAGLMWSLKKISSKEFFLKREKKVDFIIFKPVLQMGGKHFSLLKVISSAQALTHQRCGSDSHLQRLITQHQWAFTPKMKSNLKKKKRITPTPVLMFSTVMS